MANYVNLLIIGAGGYGQVVKELAEDSGKYNRIEFLDDNNSSAIGKIADSKNFLRDFPYAVIAIGNPAVREKLFIELETVGFQLVNIMSAQSKISSSAKLGKGCVIEPNITVCANSVIGNGVILCAGSVVGHNATVRDYCQIDYNGVVAVGAELPAGTKVAAGSVYKNQAKQ
ncbi:MAG: hypothetical protein K2O44_02120 [Clostridia bacterium]|nr:hypothetical protein [Clostridia bacterium]